MALLSRLSHLFPVGAEAPIAVLDAEPTPQNQRKVALRCLGCNSWNRSRLVYMSNGGDYCYNCARQISRRYGYAVAGKRWTDITALD